MFNLIAILITLFLNFIIFIAKDRFIYEAISIPNTEVSTHASRYYLSRNVLDK